MWKKQYTYTVYIQSASCAQCKALQLHMYMIESDSD